MSGSFRQGNPTFGYTTEIQYDHNVLYALCWSQVKKVYQCNTYDSDHVLTEGNCLYNSLGTIDLLSVDELPRSLVMSDYNIFIDFLEVKIEITHFRIGDTFIQRIVTN